MSGDFSTMNPLQFSVQNIIDGQAIPIAITGMGIVFCVLALISLFIALLPKLTAILGRFFPETEVQPSAPKTSSNDAVLAAIAYVFHMRRR
jgi:Na+-transporting methylmalonyl-CoA/oxaloacetate decarboxylase gamma subunit